MEIKCQNIDAILINNYSKTSRLLVKNVSLYD